MTVERAFEVLTIQLFAAELDEKKSWQKTNFINALKVALKVLDEKIKADKEVENDERRI